MSVMSRIELAREAIVDVLEMGRSDVQPEEVEGWSLEDCDDFLAIWGLEWDGQDYSNA